MASHTLYSHVRPMLGLEPKPDEATANGALERRCFSAAETPTRSCTPSHPGSSASARSILMRHLCLQSNDLSLSRIEHITSVADNFNPITASDRPRLRVQAAVQTVRHQKWFASPRQTRATSSRLYCRARSTRPSRSKATDVPCSVRAWAGPRISKAVTLPAAKRGVVSTQTRLPRASDGTETP